jgi:hypothetical protein
VVRVQPDHRCVGLVVYPPPEGETPLTTMGKRTGHGSHPVLSARRDEYAHRSIPYPCLRAP